MGILPVRRRFLLAGLAAGLCASRAATAQPRPKRVVHVMFWGPETAADLAQWRTRHEEAWARHGMREGRDYHETLLASGPGADPARVARDVVASRPDLIIVGAGGMAQTIQRLTSDIPVVFYDVSDPLMYGLVQSYRRPGGNLTGTTTSVVESSIKRCAIIKELRPAARRIARLVPQQSAKLLGAEVRQRDAIASRAANLGLEVVEVEFPVAPSIDLDGLVRAITAARVDGLITHSFPPGVLPALQRATLVPVVGNRLDVWQGLVAVFAREEDQFDLALRVAVRILRGESPATIPVELPTRWRLGVNVSAAHSLGIEVSPSLLMRADEVVR